MACSHRGCACTETPVRQAGKAYCSETCATVDRSGKHEAKCPCGHPACSSTAGKPKSPRET
jgi:hypothetical protein